MNLKRNGFSIFIWVIYLISMLVGLTVFSFVYAFRFGGNIVYAVCGGIFSVIICAILAFMCKKIFGYISYEMMDHPSVFLIVEAVFALIMIGIGLTIRIWSVPEVIEENAFFEMAKVTSEATLPTITHGASFLYVQFLHGLFLLLGNRTVVAVWAQIILQMVGIVFAFTAIRRLSGALAGDIALVFMTIIPSFYQNALTIQPHILWFTLCSVVLWLEACSIKDCSMWKSAITGIGIGAVGYLDGHGFALFFPVFIGLFLCRREKVKSAITLIWNAVLVFAFMVASFGGLIWMDSYLSKADIFSVLHAYCVSYFPKTFAMDSSWILSSPIDTTLVFFCMTIGIFSYWFGEKTERISIWIPGVLLVLAMEAFGATYDFHFGCVMTYLFGIALAGASICSLIPIHLEEYGMPDMDTEESADEEKLADIEEIVINVAEPKPLEPKVEVPRKVELIENPLPLPKKHVKKVLDYDHEVGDSDDYDVLVRDDDDYDYV